MSLQKACHSDNFFFNNGCLIKKNTIFASLFKNRYLVRVFLNVDFVISWFINNCDGRWVDLSSVKRSAKSEGIAENYVKI